MRGVREQVSDGGSSLSSRGHDNERAGRGHGGSVPATVATVEEKAILQKTLAHLISLQKGPVPLLGI